MSGVYIKGMNMPTRCAECRLSTVHGFKDRPLCDVLVEYMSYGEWEVKRLDNCPLVPVPKHGRLGDLDELKVKIKKEDNAYGFDSYGDGMYDAFQSVYQCIDAAPTVIPVDEPDMDSFIRIFEEDDKEDGMDSFIRILKD